MAVVATDMIMRLSGGSANADVNASLGGKKSSVPVSFVSTLNNLFDNVSSAEATTGITDYRCIYLHNANATDTINTVEVFVNTDTPSPTTKIQIGLDPAGIGNGDTTGEATTIATETDVPAGVTFTDSLGAANALPIGTLGPAAGIAIWIKRTVSPGTASAATDPFTLRVTGIPA